MPTSSTMKAYTFTIVATGVDYEAEGFEDPFFEAGCDDATISVQDGKLIFDFEREASNFADALITALVAVHKGGAAVAQITVAEESANLIAGLGISRGTTSLLANEASEEQAA